MECPELGPVLKAILRTVPARKVILFGSRARGEACPESDYDLLVVVPPEYKTMRVWKDLYEAASKAKRGFSLDLLLATEEDLEKKPRCLDDSVSPYPSGGLGPLCRMMLRTPWSGWPAPRAT